IRRTAQMVGSSGFGIVGDSEILPFASSVFDIVVSSSSFHFWPNKRRALLEMRRVLKPDGRIVITDWCDDYLACRICDAFLRWKDRSSQRILTSTACRSLLEECGFSVDTIECYKISWLWGLMTAVARVT